MVMIFEVIFTFDFQSATLVQTSVATHHNETDGSQVIRHRPYAVSSSDWNDIIENAPDVLQREIIPLSTALGHLLLF